MAIKGKRNVGGTQSQGPSDLFTKPEAAFIASKLQQANYKGSEFDTYQQVMFKLKELLDKK